jgi:hypothetical protein
VTLNGEWAQFSLSTHEDRLVHYRLRYFPTVERIFNEAEVLTVKPMSSGESVRIDIKSLYLATVNGRREKFETQQIKTQMVIPKGRWVALGGSRNHSDRRDRHLWGLRQNNDQSDRGLEIEIRIDPTPL